MRWYLGVLGSMAMMAACTDASGPPPSVPPPAPAPPHDGPVRHPLEALLRKGLPADAEVVYSDMHGFHGGETIVVKGSGEASVERRAHGGAEPSTKTVRVKRADLDKLAALLLEIEVWEQRQPDRAPVPDESRAGARVRAGGQESGFWEWYNDMKKNQRLIRLRELVESFVGD